MAEDVIGSAWIKIAPDLSTFEQQLLGGVGTSVKKIAGAMALLAIPAYAIDQAAVFDQNLASIAAHAGLTKTQVQAIGNAFLSTSGTALFSAAQIAQAYAPVAGQLGLVEGHALGAADSLTFMKAAMDLADASGLPLADTTSALAKVMQAYGLSVAQASGASDLLWNASAALNIPISSLADTVDKLHAKLGPLTPDLADVSTLLLDVASHGLTGSRALLLVSTGLNTLLGGSKATSAEIKALNLHLFDANKNFVGFQGVLTQLSPKLAGMTEQQRLFAEKELFGSGASKALDATLLAGLPGWEKSAKAADKTGSAHKAAGVATDTFQGKLAILKSQVSDVATKLGQDLLPYVEGFVTFVSKNLGVIEKFGAALLVFYSAKKGVGILGSIANDLGRVLGMAGRLGGMTGAASEFVQKVYVVNMGAGMGGIPLPPALGGAAPEVMGSGLLAQGGAGTLAIGGALIAAQVGADALNIKAISDNFTKQLGQLAAKTGLTTQVFDGLLQQYIAASPKQQAAIVASAQHLAAIASLQATLAGFVGKTAPQIGAGFVTIENKVATMTGDFTAANLQTNALQAYITKYGPPTSAQMLAFYNDATNINLNAFDIALSLQLAGENLQSLPASAAGIAASLKALHQSIPKSTNLNLQGLFKAGGGDVVGGTSYIVGEKGPELFTPKGSGTITSNSALGRGGRSVTIHQYFQNNTTQEFKQVIAEENRKLLVALRTH